MTVAAPPPRQWARYVPRLVVIATMLLAVAYAAFFAQRMPGLPLEQGEVAAGPGYRAIQALAHAAFGDASGWMRGLAVALFGVTCVATARFATRVTGDAVLGAFLALVWPWFPTVVALHALAAPYALDMVLTVLALATLLAHRGKFRADDGWGAAALTLLALLDPSGARNALAAAFLVILARRQIWPALGPAIGAALAVIATTPHVAVALPAVAADGFIEAARPFAVLWIAGLLGAVASRHPRVCAHLGLAGTLLCRIAPLLYIGIVAVGVRLDPAAGVIAGAVALPFALMGLFPLGVWIRRVMPEVRSVWAWIAFPVILYCGFWLLLGPVRTDRFPYAAVSQERIPDPIAR